MRQQRGAWTARRSTQTTAVKDGSELSTPAVEHLDPHQHVSDGHLKTCELDSFAGQSIRSGVDPSPFKARIRQFLLDGFFQILHIARHG